MNKYRKQRLHISELLVFGLFPLSSILENRENDVSEIGSVSVLS
jgi:hypothetical protein